MAEGRLRCCGSSLFLKKTYGVGYQLTIEKQSTGKDGVATDESLKDIVEGNVSDAVLLSNVGTELSFQLPLGSAHNFVPMLEQLDAESQKDKISAYGVSVTTLDEVFQIVARGDAKDRKDFKSAHFSSKDLAAAAAGDEDEKSVRSRMDLENEGLFGTHVQALIRKRASNFKRDKKAWCCTTILPSICVLIGMLLLKFAIPSRNLEPLPLDLNNYNPSVSVDPRNPIPYNVPNSVFTCNPGECMFRMWSIDLNETGENYSFCGGAALENSTVTCTIIDSEGVVSQIDKAGAEAQGGNAESITEVRRVTAIWLNARLRFLTLLPKSSVFLLDQSDAFPASQYGGIFLTHDRSSETSSGASYASAVSEACSNDIGDYTTDSECDLYGSGIGYTIAYNFTGLHVSVCVNCEFCFCPDRAGHLNVCLSLHSPYSKRLQTKELFARHSAIVSRSQRPLLRWSSQKGKTSTQLPLTLLTSGF